MASPQHRCVFVGNIPYDATEEQLIQICEEVGPVVSFRLVIDRETGKPKGYGFCEYKDEETALSARRNLQGYEINGRQLRVDFAENDKNNDRSREQGRGGPGMVPNADPQKQIGGPAVHGDSGLHQPVGLPVAMAAASVMAGALGGVQTGLQAQPTVGTDPLTLHLAKMSRNQLNEILSEIKVMATQNREQARQLLLVSPQLPKALFQAQIILGVVPPQMLQMPNIHQASGQLAQPLLQDGQQGQQLAGQTFPGLPPLVQNKMLMPQSQLPAQPRFQHPQPAQNQVLQQGSLPGLSGGSILPSMRPQPLSNVPVRSHIQGTSFSFMTHQAQPPLLQHPGLQPALLARPPLPEHGFQPSTSIMSALPNNVNKDSDRPPQVTNDPTWSRRVDTYQSLPSGLSKKESMANDSSDPINRPSKMLKLDEGRGTSTSVPGSSQAFGIGNQVPKAEAASNSRKQTPQLAPDVESALLQQVLNLTPEQLSSLPPDQQQQVIQLQQRLRQPT